jgi:hypothetical protein
VAANVVMAKAVAATDARTIFFIVFSLSIVLRILFASERSHHLRERLQTGLAD